MRPTTPQHLGHHCNLALLAAATMSMASAACHTALPPHGVDPTPRRNFVDGVSRSSDLLVQSQLVATGTPTLFEAVRRLRPDLVSPRRPGARNPRGAYPLVYLDNQFEGSIDVLHGILSEMVTEVRVLSPIEANFRFSTREHPAGAIMISTMRRR